MTKHRSQADVEHYWGIAVIVLMCAAVIGALGYGFSQVIRSHDEFDARCVAQGGTPEWGRDIGLCLKDGLILETY